MIEIATSSASLDLNSDAKITIKQKSSLFTILEKEAKQSYSYPFTLPVSSNNNRVISNILEEQKEETLQAVVRKNGVRLFKADLIVTERTNTNYEVALQLNQKEDFFNRKMNTLFEELGVFFITDSTHFVDFLAYPYTEMLGGFPNPAHIPQYFVVSGIVYEFEINDPDNFGIQIINIINGDTANNNAFASIVAFNTIRIERVNSSLPFSAYTVEKESTYNIFWFALPKDNGSNKTSAVQHANTTDSLLDFRSVEYCFPFFTTVMPGQSTNFITINDFTTSYTTGEYNITLPSLRITAIIEKILNTQGWKLESAFLKEEEIEKLFLLNCYGIAKEGASNWDTIQNLQFFYADCLPDLSFAELINKIELLFCLKVEYDHIRKILKIEPINLALSKKIAKDYSCTPVFSQKTKEKEGYTFKYNYPDYEDYVETYMFSDKIIWNGSKEIVFDFPFLATNNLFGQIVKLFDGGLRINNSLATFNKNSLKFLNQNMWLRDGECKSINFMDYTTRQAHYFTETYSLTLDNLYEQFWKKYLNLLDKSEVEREIIFTFSDLQGIDLTELIRLEYSNYFIKEIEYTLTNNEQIRILAKVNLIKTI